MEQGVNDLIEISRFYGSNPEYIIAGGGNTSFKNDEKLWIKASGSSLATIGKDGFVCLSRSELKKISEKTYSENSSEREAEVKADLHRAILYPENKRPSVETSLHEIIGFPLVVHTHPTLVNALMCSNNAQQTVRKLFGNEVLFVEYTDPGYILFKKVEAEIIKFRKEQGEEPSVIFLQNHGVFVGANSIDEIKTIYGSIEKKLRSCITASLPATDDLAAEKPAEQIAALLEQLFGVHLSGVLFSANALVQSFVKNRETFAKVNKPFTPDDIVYCKSNYAFSSSHPEELKRVVSEFKNRCGYLPKVIAVQGEGLLAVEENPKSAQTVMEVFQNMMKVSFYSENFGGPHFMTQQQIDFIDSWEVENYRRQIAKQ
ncbi:MAG: class II aldolase/adducin family protein [Prolixibacteraceae bacterium]|jgi:rhamnose utilization protein RhaD (predicted bifunctional aldolase and dehydrogenase)|nr:class II aldolase/adducin family protein [Prolixibacteraceae bacterium]